MTGSRTAELGGVAGRRISRRAALVSGGALAGSWLCPLARALASTPVAAQGDTRPRSVILLWLAGGPSQLETFDPHPGRAIAAGTKAIDTSLPGVQLAEGLPQTAEVLSHWNVIRSLVSKEGDHARGAHLGKTGYNPDPTAEHPALGAVLCHELPDAKVNIPLHVSILPDAYAARGGFLGANYDAFQTPDPALPVPDVTSPVTDQRLAQRLADLEVVEREFAQGRRQRVAATMHRPTMEIARRMMGSAQLQAFDPSVESAALRATYGDTPFGRGCLVARRLVEVGVRTVEVTLAGWDSHVNNHNIQRGLVDVLDPALAALTRDLVERDLWDRTVVLCGGEFGRTPRVNPLEGRDHWPHGFSFLIGGGGLRSGIVLGETDPDGGRQVQDPLSFADLHATVYRACGLDPAKENISPVGRPLALSPGRPIAALQS